MENLTKLTKKEQLVYDFIAETIRRDGYSPSVRDIAQAVDIKSTSTVHHYLNKLEAKGYIQKESGKSRTLRIEGTENEKKMTGKAGRRKQQNQIPLLGKVAAGAPIAAVENIEGYVDGIIDTGRYEAGELFALTIQGNSMIEAGILNGDIVIVQRTSYAENGDIVIALLDDEATCKAFYKEDGHFRLQPRNASMEPIYTDSVMLLGKVIASFRKYR